jgi:hypothetical protein
MATAGGVPGKIALPTAGSANVMTDLGLTHVAFSVRDLDVSVAFYEKSALMTVVHRRVQEGVIRVA